ncbi:hypothetical protein [Blastococcus mobilis]|uniref:Uncharacterized protein n=1 Tax=Blastococcus mobilis TaxID=1938746 RepID=A0A238VGD1_9ACTN|nr:hypothetical protein [Blastococcus mobilis]SNR33127.1 hypothetical protein SAMN06272737_10394 [Blastococcus mobilis]
MKLSGLLSTDSLLTNVLFPVDPTTGERTRAEPVTVLDDPDAVDAFFARQAG